MEGKKHKRCTTTEADAVKHIKATKLGRKHIKTGSVKPSATHE